MSEELEVLKLVTQCLNRESIPYMITGSIATNFYTIPRMTRDIDIVIELAEGKIDDIYKVFKGQFYVDKGMITEAIKQQKTFNIIHNETLIKVDFIIRKEAEYRRLEFKRRYPIKIEGTPMFIATAEDLVISKLFWAKESHSELQLGDVRNILKSVKDIDLKYIEKWVEKLGLENIYREVAGE